MTAFIHCDRCGKQAVWSPDVDGPVMAMLSMRIVGGPNHRIGDEDRNRLAGGLAPPHLCAACVAALHQWIAAGS